MEYGKPKYGVDLAEFILSNIGDKTLINEGIEDAVNAVIEFVTNGIDRTMNKYN